jgi:hypothetical protein
MDLIEDNLRDPISHWYYAHKFKYLKEYIGDELATAVQLVDVGAGSALFSREILRENPNLKVLAIDTGYPQPKQADPDQNITYLNSGSGVSGEIYLFTDVLEHVLDDVKMLGEYVDLAPANSKFIITVPAFMSLWSGHDVFLKHFRRYRRKEISLVVEQTGLKVLKSEYLYTSLFPLAWIIRHLPNAQDNSSQLKNHGSLVNRIILWSLQLDFIFSRLSPFGISVIVLAEKIDT